MKNLNKKLTKIKKYSLYFLPPILFFSYYPVLIVGKDASMNLEFSLPLIWLLFYSILSLPTFFHFLKNIRLNFLSLSLSVPILASISILWSPNKLRAILTAGIIWCLYITAFSIYDLFKQKSIKNDKKYKNNLLKILFVSTIIICIFCWLQCILDVAGVSRETTLLCLGCVSGTFGFPHPNGFAIEPQFMGNLLLLPSLLSLFLFLKAENRRQKLFLGSTSLFFVATLFITFSRGAIYSFGVAIAVFLIFSCLKQKSLQSLLILPIIVFSFLLTLSMQGVFAMNSSTNDTFLTGISKSVNQLSLGFIDLNLQNNPVENFSQETEVEPVENSENSSVFDGYVEESTNVRLGLSALALRAWLDKPNTFLFGFGLGSAGTILNIYDDTIDSDKQIVQNEFVEIALELGLIGVLLVGLAIVAILIILKKQNNIFLLSVLLAFGISFCFFSGFTNALHIFLLPPLFYFVFKDDFIISKISHKHTN